MQFVSYDDEYTIKGYILIHVLEEGVFVSHENQGVKQGLILGAALYLWHKIYQPYMTYQTDEYIEGVQLIEVSRDNMECHVTILHWHHIPHNI